MRPPPWRMTHAFKNLAIRTGPRPTRVAGQSRKRPARRRTGAVLGAALLALLAATPSFASGPVAVTVLNPTDDTVVGGHHAKPMGNSRWIKLGAGYTGLFKFDLAAIPSTAQVREARLRTGKNCRVPRRRIGRSAPERLGRAGPPSSRVTKTTCGGGPGRRGRRATFIVLGFASTFGAGAAPGDGQDGLRVWGGRLRGPPPWRASSRR